jgi:hypothetical protein
MNKYPFGLREASIEPQEYKLSHVLATYREGFKDEVTTSIRVKDATVADGYLDFRVPIRTLSMRGFSRTMTNRLALAWKVLQGKADILFYE